jgi:hypothetical protein
MIRKRPISNSINIMPRILRTRRIQRHYAPPTSRARFSPERLLFDSALCTSRTIFKPEGSLQTRDEEADVFIDDVSDNTSDTLISKPSGQVTRLRRDGYNLLDKLKWKHEFYLDVQVRFISIPTLNAKYQAGLCA